MSQYTVAAGDRADGSTFTVPGDVSSDASYAVDDPDRKAGKQWYVHVANGWDVNADVTVQGSHYQDEALDSPADDGPAETVNAGANGVFDGTTGHSYIQVNVDPASGPTSGDLVVTFQHRDE